MSIEHWMGIDRSRCANPGPPLFGACSVSDCNASRGAGRCCEMLRRMSLEVSFNTSRLGLAGRADFVFVTAIAHLLPIGARSCSETGYPEATADTPSARCISSGRVRGAEVPRVDH